MILYCALNNVILLTSLCLDVSVICLLPGILKMGISPSKTHISQPQFILDLGNNN